MTDMPFPKPTPPVDTSFALAKANDDLRAIAERVEQARRAWGNVAYLFAPKLPCPECGGTGQMMNGVFGSTQCFECGGARVVDSPNPDYQNQAEGPDFAKLYVEIDRRRALLAPVQQAAARAKYEGNPPPAFDPSSLDLATLSAMVDGASTQVETVREQRKSLVAGNPGAHE